MIVQNKTEQLKMDKYRLVAEAVVKIFN